MSRWTARTLLAGLAFALMIGAAAAQTKPLKLACYAPLTGPLAQYGKSMDNGLQLALSDAKAAGKLNSLDISIACEDDQNRADDGITLAHKFIEDDAVVAVIGSWSSTVTLAAGPVYNDAKLVDITPIASHPDITKIGPYVFRQSVLQAQEGPANAAYLKQLGAKTIAMIGQPNDFGKANVGFTKRAFETQGGKVVFEEDVRLDAQDFRQVLEKATREQPDYLYIGLFAPQAALLVKQAKQLGLTTPMYGDAALASIDFLRLAGPAADGMKLQIVFNPAIGPAMADFFERYKARFGAEPDPFAVNCYITGTMLLDIAARQAPSVTRESIRQGLDDERSIESIAGNLTYDPASREWNFHFLPGTVDQGQFKLVK